MILRTILLCFVAVGLSAQTATPSHFLNPNIRGVTIGSHYCYLWFHAAAWAGYDAEVACYGFRRPQMFFYTSDNLGIPGGVQFPDGWISWLIQPQPDGTLRLQLGAVGAGDVVIDGKRGVLIDEHI